jgi:flagellar hook protein FlgE
MIKTSLTGVMAASRDLSVISNNLANSMTTGFKRSLAQFTDIGASSAAGREGAQAGNGALAQDIRRSVEQGPIMTTDAKLDVAVAGMGYLTFGDANAQPGQETSMTYSRAGKLTLDKSGRIVDASGAPLMGFSVLSGNGVGGQLQPINLSTAAGGNLANVQGVEIDSKGVVTVQLASGRTVRAAAIALATFRNDNGLKSIGGAKLQETDASGPADVQAAGRNGMGEVKQGALEGANVDLTAELMRMVQAQQAYNGNARALQTNSEMLRSSIETLIR